MFLRLTFRNWTDFIVSMTKRHFYEGVNFTRYDCFVEKTSRVRILANIKQNYTIFRKIRSNTPLYLLAVRVSTIATLSLRRRTFNYARAFARVRQNVRRKLADYLKFRDEKRYTFASDIKRPLLKHETFRRGVLRKRAINIHDLRSYRTMARRLE